MKRLIQIANLDQATHCFKQQKFYKTQLKILSDYNKSLEYYKSFVKQIKTKTQKYCEDINSLFIFKKHKTKKRSLIDYFTIMLENLAQHLTDQTFKVVNILETTYNEAKQFERKTDKLISDSNKMMEEQISYHQKIFKEYMLTVYPQTNSIFFRLHGTDKKFNKKQDPAKEASLVQQFKAYQQILNFEIDKINYNITQMNQKFRTKTEDIKVGYVKLFEACLPEFQGEFREEELSDFKQHVEVRRKNDKNILLDKEQKQNRKHSQRPKSKIKQMYM